MCIYICNLLERANTGWSVQSSPKNYQFFSQRVSKLFGNIIKLPECLKTPYIFNQYSSKNKDNLILFGYFSYQIVRFFGKCFTFGGSTNSLKYLFSNLRLKHF